MTTQILSSRNYDRLKVVTQIWLPALATFYFTIAQIWGLPFAEQIVGSMTALVLLCGVMLGVSKAQYDKSGAGLQGAILIDSSNPEKDIFRLELKESPEAMKEMDKVTFKIDSSHDLQGL